MSHLFSRQRARFLGIVMSAFLALGAVLVHPAAADNATGTITVLGGGLAMSLPGGPDFGTVNQSILPTGTLAGPATIDIDVKDLRGTGGGWNLQITSTEFSTGGGTPYTLPPTSLKIVATLGLCDLLTICVLPLTNVAAPVTVPAGPTAPAPVKFFNAIALTGMGDMNVTPAFTLSIPANTMAGTYTSTMTVTIAAGP